jgi:hypothetical protein
MILEVGRDEKKQKSVHRKRIVQPLLWYDYVWIPSLRAIGLILDTSKIKARNYPKLVNLG